MQSLNLGMNTISKLHINQINSFCTRNAENSDKNSLPVIRHEIE